MASSRCIWSIGQLPCPVGKMEPASRTGTISTSHVNATPRPTVCPGRGLLSGPSAEELGSPLQSRWRRCQLRTDAVVRPDGGGIQLRMNPALDLAAPSPAAGAQGFSRLRAARARHASDRRESARFKRMPRQIRVPEYGNDLVPRRAGKRVEFQPRAVDLDQRQRGTGTTVISLAAVDPAVERGERPLERLDLA